MATPEFELSSQPDASPENEAPLRIVSAEAALGQTIEVTPVELPITQLRPVELFEDFKTRLHGLIREGDYERKTLEEMMDIRTEVQAVRAALTARYAELAKLEAVLQREMTWTNGYLIDINKAIQAKQQPPQS